MVKSSPPQGVPVIRLAVTVGSVATAAAASNWADVITDMSVAEVYKVAPSVRCGQPARPAKLTLSTRYKPPKSTCTQTSPDPPISKKVLVLLSVCVLFVPDAQDTRANLPSLNRVPACKA